MTKSKFKVLVLSDFSGIDANVVRDFLYCFNQHSRHDYYYLHRWSKNDFRRLHQFDFNRFDAIILFWDFFWIGCEEPLSYCYVPEWVSDRIAEARALKIQFLQDEYRDVRKVNRVMKRFGVNVMFSCVAPVDQELFYPKAGIPSLVATYPVLTGYVPTYLERIDWPAHIERRIDIGYRSRSLPFHLGSLGQEKVTIAHRFQEIADKFGFSANISVKETDRIYGTAWLDFMKACRFSIGTESGASVVDFDGQIRRRTQDYLHEYPGASFEDVKAAVFAHLDGKVVVQTISPRIFEASAFENTLVLHEGHYEGMLQPDVHYISVEKDYSNVLDVVERMKDRAFCEDLAKNAKEALIESKKYNYQSFAAKFDEVLETHVPARSGEASVSRTTFYLMNYLNNDRLFPYEGGFRTIPHSCDLIHLGHTYAPYLLVVVYSLGVILNLICQGPKAMVQLIKRCLSNNGARGTSLAGLLRDLRVLGLLLRMRAAARPMPGVPFDIRLTFDRRYKDLVARGVPWPEELPVGESQRDLRLKIETAAVNDFADIGLPFSIIWDNRAVGNGLPICASTSKILCVYLNDDCMYRFETLNTLSAYMGADEVAVIRRSLLAGWKAPSWLDKGYAVMLLSWMVITYFLFEKPMAWLRKNALRPSVARETVSH